MGIKSKKTFKLDGILGVDLTSHPAKVQKNRASYMKNMICEGGINRKRRGFHQIYQLLDENDLPLRINGIHPYADKDGRDRLLIHAGAMLFNEEGEKISTSLEITDTPSRLLTVNGTGYLVGCGGVYIFDGEKLSVAEPYVPTVFQGYERRYVKDREAESVNIITERARGEFCGDLFEDDEVSVFNLPADVDWDKDVTFTVAVSPFHNTVMAMTGDDYNYDRDHKITEEVTAKFIINGGTSDEQRTIRCTDFTKDGRKLYIFDENLIPTNRAPTLYLIGNKTSFYTNFNTSPYKTGDFNIKVSYSRKDIRIKALASSPFGEAVQDNRGETRLVLRGGEGCESQIFFSDSFDGHGVAYFPVACSVTVGEGGPITAFLKLSDRYLGVFKSDRFYRYTFYHYPYALTLSEKYYLNGYEGRDRRGCINNLCCGRDGSDLLVFDGSGVYGIEEVSSESDRCFLSLRSSNIEKALKSHTPWEISRARACVHDGRYLLFIGNSVYVADTRYTFSDGVSHQYEWWLWSGPDASCVQTANGRLLIGDKNGAVYTLGNDYRDVTVIKNTREGDTLYLSDKGVFVINEDTGVRNATHVKLKGIASFLKKGDFEAFSSTSSGISRICISAPDGLWRVSDGSRLLLEMADGTGRDAYLRFLADDAECGVFSLTDISGAPLTDLICKDISSVRIYEEGGTEYRLVSEEEGYATYLDGERVDWIITDTLPALSLIKWDNVEAEYVSPMLNFGEDKLKTLYRLGISVLSKQAAGILFGYETRKSALTELEGMEGFDLKSFDFDKMSLEHPFAKTLERRVYERNFNYVAFKLISTGCCDCALGDIYAVYTVNNHIQGVR